MIALQALARVHAKMPPVPPLSHTRDLTFRPPFVHLALPAHHQEEPTNE